METKYSTCKLAKWILSGPFCWNAKKPHQRRRRVCLAGNSQLSCLLLQWILEVLAAHWDAQLHTWNGYCARRDRDLTWPVFLAAFGVVSCNSFQNKLHNRCDTSKPTMKWPGSQQRWWLTNSDSTQISRLIVRAYIKTQQSRTISQPRCVNSVY